MNQRSGKKDPATAGTMLIYASSERFFDGEAARFFERWKDEGEVTSVQGAGLDPGQLTAFLQSKGIFESVTLVHVRGADKMPPAASKRLLEYLRSPMEGVVLCLEYAGDLSERNRKLDRTWREISGLVKPVNLNPHSAKAYIQKRAKGDGLSIEDDAVAALESWAGKQLALLPGAMDLLCVSAMETGKITQQDVVDLLGTGGSPSVFELQDRFMEKDPYGVIEAVRKIENDSAASPIAFVSILSRQLGHVAKLHALMANGVHLGQVTPEMVDKGLQFWQFDKVKAGFQRWSAGEAMGALTSMARLDKALKGDPIEPWAAVEKHLISLIMGRADGGLTAGRF